MFAAEPREGEHDKEGQQERRQDTRAIARRAKTARSAPTTARFSIRSIATFGVHRRIRVSVVAIGISVATVGISVATVGEISTVGVNHTVGEGGSVFGDAIALGTTADLVGAATNGVTRIIDTLPPRASLPATTSHQRTRIRHALSSVTHLIDRTTHTETRVVLTLAITAALIGWARFVGTGRKALAIAAELACVTGHGIAWIVNALTTPADLTTWAGFARLVAIVRGAKTLFTEITAWARNIGTRGLADPVAADFTCGASELVTGKDTHADFLAVHVLAGLTARAFGGAGAQASPANAQGVASAIAVAFVDFSIAIVVDPIADLEGWERCRTDNPVPTTTRSRAFAALGLAFFGDRLIGSRDVVDQSVAIVVDAVADLDACAIIVHEQFRHSGRHLSIKRFERHFDLDPRVIHNSGFCAVLNRSAPIGGRKGGLCWGCACSDFDGSSGGCDLLPRDGLPAGGALCAMNARPMATCNASDALELKARHIRISVGALAVCGVLACELACASVDLGGGGIALCDSPHKTIRVNGHPNAALTDLCVVADHLAV